VAVDIPLPVIQEKKSSVVGSSAGDKKQLSSLRGSGKGPMRIRNLLMGVRSLTIRKKKKHSD
jgi:hypothetical protein